MVFQLVSTKGSSRGPRLFCFPVLFAKVSVSMLFIKYGVWIGFADREFEMVVITFVGLVVKSLDRHPQLRSVT